MQRLSDSLGSRIQELGSRKDINILLPKETRTSNSKRIARTAGELVERFQSPDHRNFFLKVAWHLPKGTIDRLVGTAFERATQSPRAYFIALAKAEMKR